METQNTRMLEFFDGKKKTVTVSESLSDGAKEKFWCYDEAGLVFLYKQDKQQLGGEYTYESVSEFLAKEIGDRLQIPVVPILLGNHFILSQAVEAREDVRNFIELSEELSHSFHMSNLITYTLGTLLSDKNKYKSEVIQMLLFDILIGNSDRHPANFGYTKNEFYPLFDNGSSLCAYEREEAIPHILKDPRRFKAICFSKSRPTIRGEKKLTHYELLMQLKELYPTETGVFSKSLKGLYVQTVLNKLPITALRMELLSRFLQTRIDWFSS